MDIILDIETADPDDILTLSFLATHPRSKLRAVTVTPGSPRQVGLVRLVLKRLGLEGIPVGSFNTHTGKNHVSGFHDRWLGHIPAEEPDGPGSAVLSDALKKYPDATLVTGAPLKNPGKLFLETDAVLKRWVAQGGFAGDSVVPEESRLDKFKGLETCPTYNFGGAPQEAEKMLSTPNIHLRHLVSKNVCHGLTYDKDLHREVFPHREAHPGLALLYEGMGVYLQKKRGKKFHDPLAACVALNPKCVEMREVEVYRDRGKWGSRLQAGTNTFISVALNREEFMSTLLEKA